jgi:hypothetical protein
MEFRFYLFQKVDTNRPPTRPVLSDLYVKDAIRAANNKLSKDVSIEETLQFIIVK